VNGPATQAKLWELHALLLEALLEHFRDPPGGRVSPVFAAIARSFLRDNGTVRDAIELRDLRRNLAELRGLALPFPTPDRKDQ
jgi:hypothetical protein